ncbi:uncharacterized protein [Haliotis asinina]|uniref:uncharacterized protein n=1 Tax=Haliotis asinina TaxID=109174 RepID=UPI0035322870
MALDSNISPKTLQSMPEVDAAKASLPEKNHQDVTLKKVQDDAVIVYAAVDRKKALEVANYMKNLKMMTGEGPRISLYDVPKFGGSSIDVPEKLLANCRVIFILLTPNFKLDAICNYVLRETLGDTRLERDSSDPKKYCVRPLHTQPKGSRDYKTPCGLKSICAFDVYDLHNGHNGQRLLDFLNYNRGLQITGYCHDQREDQNKFCKENKSDANLAETSLVNDYATIGPSSSSPHTRTMTNVFNQAQSTPGPHEDTGRQMALREQTSDDHDVSDGSYSMEARLGSESLKEGENRCITEYSESPVQNNQYAVPFSNDTNTESSHCLNLVYSTGSLFMDGKQSGFESSTCPTIAGKLKTPVDTGDLINAAVHDPDQTHVKRGGSSCDVPDHSEKNTDKRDNHPNTGADIVSRELLVCSTSREPGGHVIDASNAPTPDEEKTEQSLSVVSGDNNPEDSFVRTNTTGMAKEVQQSTFSETHDPKIQRCSHLGSASPFRKADSAHNTGTNNLLSPLVDVSDITNGIDWKLGLEETSTALQGDSYREHIIDQQGDTITEPAMKTSGPGHLSAPLCSPPSREDRSLFEPQSTKDDPPKTPVQETESDKHTSGLPHADDVPVSPNLILPAAQLSGTPSSATYVFINDCSHIELSGDVHLVNVNSKTEGGNTGRKNQQPKAKKKHGSLALMPRNRETSSGNTSSSTSRASAIREKSSTDMLPKTQAAGVSEVTPKSELGRYKQDAQEGARCPEDLSEDPSGLQAVESRKEDKISDSCLTLNGSGADFADKSNSSKDERKKSKRKMICFPFLRRRNKKK